MLDTIDQSILEKRIAKRRNLVGPLVGDFVRLTNGDMRRFTHDWGDDIQITIAENCDSSFHLSNDGSSDFSGSLDSAILKIQIKSTDEFKDGSFWFFSHCEVKAHNGVHVMVPCRVYELESNY